MPLSLALCICGAVVSLVCICYGVVSSLRIRKKEKAELKKKQQEEQLTNYLFLSTKWLMVADLYGIRISNFTPAEYCDRGFQVVFSKKSSDKIARIANNDSLSSALYGHFIKFGNNRYCFSNVSLKDAQHDIEKFVMYHSLMAISAVESGGNDGR